MRSHFSDFCDMPVSKNVSRAKSSLRLADFITQNMEAILKSWVSFARTIAPSTGPITTIDLRDHAKQILEEIAADICKPQTTAASIAKSKGGGPTTEGNTASETHADTRILSGFSIGQMVSEYRALRSSVLLLWSKQANRKDTRDRDIMRFNEAIDKGITESVSRYSKTVSDARDISLGILAHDLRSPLSAILLSAEYLFLSDELDVRYIKVATRIYSSVKRVDSIVGNLLDFTRARVGPGIPLKLVRTNLTAVCEGIMLEARVCHPGKTILFEAQGEWFSEVDASRMEQVFSNLINNAIKHGSDTEPVTVTQQSHEACALFKFHNEGEAIPKADFERIFDPMRRNSQKAINERGPEAGLGLGLFIAKEIMMAHGGDIRVESSQAGGTDFTVRIPLAKG